MIYFSIIFSVGMVMSSDFAHVAVPDVTTLLYTIMLLLSSKLQWHVITSFLSEIQCRCAYRIVYDPCHCIDFMWQNTVWFYIVFCRIITSWHTRTNGGRPSNSSSKPSIHLSTCCLWNMQFLSLIIKLFSVFQNISFPKQCSYTVFSVYLVFI